MLKKINYFAVFVLMVTVVKIAMTPWVFHGDIITQAGWGEWVYKNGMRGFYEHNVWTYGWPNHPPLISSIYSWGFYIYNWLHTAMILTGSFVAENHLGAGHLLWFYRFVEWWGNAKYIDTPFKFGELISMKLIPIVADLVLGAMVYQIVKKKFDETKAKLCLVIYLLSPFSWYESALWGQNDQLALIFVLAGLGAITSKKWAMWAPLAMGISVLLKPTGLILGPYFLWLAMGDRERLKKVVVGSVLAIGMYYFYCRQISRFDVVTFNVNLMRQIFVKGELWTWVNTFNFWRVASHYLTNYQEKFLGITMQVWGYFLFLLVNAAAFWISRRRNWWAALVGLFIVSSGGWLFIVTMHERYLFGAVVVGLVLAMVNRKLLYLWGILSLVFWINMYNGWWVPEGMSWLRNLLTFDDFFDGIVPKLLSIVNLVVIGVMAGIASRDDKC